MTIFRDILILIGAAAILFGCWQLHPAMAWILGGALLFIGGIAFVAYDEQKKRGRR